MSWTSTCPASRRTRSTWRSHDGYLTIQASKGLDKDQQDKDGKYIRQERYAGSCSRSFYIGEDVPAEDISAKYEDGILRLSVPKADQKELPKTSTIAIE